MNVFKKDVESKMYVITIHGDWLKNVLMGGDFSVHGTPHFISYLRENGNSNTFELMFSPIILTEHPAIFRAEESLLKH